MTNIIKAVADHLEFLGIGTVADASKDGDIFWGHMPDTPDNCITVFSADSGLPGNGGKKARIQIMTRGKSYKWAYEKSQEIAEELGDFNGFLSGDGASVICSAVNISTGCGADDKKRELVTSNYTLAYCDA